MSLLLVLLFGCPKSGAVVSPLDAALDAELPVDPAVTIGVLDNGLHYYVEENHLPESRVVLRLVLDAGSALEDDDQRGLAHLLEHMAFNGTEHFPGNEMVRVIEGMGARFGPHLNAHTSFDETVYKLTVPSDPESVAIGLQVLEDWASGMSLDTEEIEAERGVVLEEWRTRLGAGDRIFDQTLPAMWFGSKYVDRLTIGTEESLRTFTPDAVRRYYADWYRPELMAVVVVGDVDPAAMATEIEARFSKLKGPESPRERVRFPVPAHDDTKIVIFADPELQQASVRLSQKHDDPEGTTKRSYRDDLVKGLATAILNERLAALAESDDPPYLGAGGGDGKIAPGEASFSVSARVREDGLPVGLEALVTEVERIRRHGFRQSELDRARTSSLKMYEQLLAEKATTESTVAVDELVRVYLHGESVPGIDNEVAIAREMLPTITLSDLTDWAKTWFAADSRVLVALLPKKDGVTPPTEDELRAIITKVEASTIDALPEEAPLPPLLDESPKPGAVVTRAAGPLGFERWDLANGAVVYSKKTAFKADEVVWSASSPGGLSLIDDTRYTSAASATQISHRSGFGNLDATQYKRWSAGKVASVWHAIDNDTDSFGGSASAADLGSALEVQWASLVKPRFTADGATKVREEQLAAVRNRSSDPNSRFSEAWNELLWPKTPRWQQWTEADVMTVDRETAAAAFAERYHDVSQTTFVFVGALPDDFEQQVTTFIGGLPGGGEPEVVPPDATRPPKGKVEAVVNKGLEPKARVRWMYHTPLDPSLVGTSELWSTRATLDGLGTLLRTRLREELREKLSGVYGVGVSASAWRSPDHRVVIRIDFTCDPERVAELEAATQAVIDEVRTQIPDERYVKQHQEQVRLSRQEDEQSNDFWRDALLGAIERGEDPALVEAWEERLQKVDGVAIRAAAKSWLGDDRVRLVMLPEDTK